MLRLNMNAVDDAYYPTQEEKYAVVKSSEKKLTEKLLHKVEYKYCLLSIPWM